MAELTASLAETVANTNAGPDGDLARDRDLGNIVYSNPPSSPCCQIYPGHAYHAARGHSYYRSYLVFDTSGIDTAPLLEVTGTMATSLQIYGRAASDALNIIVYKANLTSSTAALNNANYNDFDGWVSGSAFTGSIYGKFLTGSVMTVYPAANAYQPITGTAALSDAMQNEDLVSLVILEYDHDAQYDADVEASHGPWVVGSGGWTGGASPPKIVYAAGTTQSKTLGVTPGNQKSILGTTRDKTAKVGGRV